MDAISTGSEMLYQLEMIINEQALYWNSLTVWTSNVKVQSFNGWIVTCCIARMNDKFGNTQLYLTLTLIDGRSIVKVTVIPETAEQSVYPDQM